MLSGRNGIPIVYNPAPIASTATGGGTMTTVSFTCATGCAQQGNYTPLFEYADTLSYTRGRHAFKGGVDVRIGYTKGYERQPRPSPRRLAALDRMPI
jgi:hypothetical protein